MFSTSFSSYQGLSKNCRRHKLKVDLIINWTPFCIKKERSVVFALRIFREPTPGAAPASAGLMGICSLLRLCANKTKAIQRIIINLLVPLFAFEMYKSFPLESYTLFSFLLQKSYFYVLRPGHPSMAWRRADARKILCDKKLWNSPKLKILFCFQ